MDNQPSRVPPPPPQDSQDISVHTIVTPTTDALANQAITSALPSPTLTTLPAPILNIILSYLPRPSHLTLRFVHPNLATSIAEIHLKHFFLFPHPPSIIPFRLLARHLSSLTLYLPIFANPLAAPHYHHSFIRGVPELEALWTHFCAREVEIEWTGEPVGSPRNAWGLFMWGMGAQGYRAYTWPVEACEEVGEVTQWDVDGVLETVRELLRGCGAFDGVEVVVKKIRISGRAGPPVYQTWEHENGGIDGVRYDGRGQPIDE